MIPKIIWQTYKTSPPPLAAVKAIKTWIDLNPDYTWCYMDDVQCDQFISDHFDQEFVDMYRLLPYGIMRSDVWRIAVVYIYGGIYADLDTICLKPADSWIKDKNLVASVEPPTLTIGNFAFAAKPKHPAMYRCLEQVMLHYYDENYLNKKTHTDTPIQNFGAHAFTVGISQYYNTKEKILEDNAIIYAIEDNAFTPTPTDKSLVGHQTASIFWTDNYDSWRTDQNEIFNKVN